MNFIGIFFQTPNCNYCDFKVVDHEDDEPSILATKSFLSTPPTTVPANILPSPPTTVATDNLHTPPKTLSTVNSVITTQPQRNVNLQETGTGYSHLEWSSSIPYNVAEEPDDVQGKYDTSFESSNMTYKV